MFPSAAITTWASPSVAGRSVFLLLTSSRHSSLDSCSRIWTEMTQQEIHHNFHKDLHKVAVWRSLSSWVSNNVVALRRARLVLGWVIDRWLKSCSHHLGIQSTTQVHSAWPSLRSARDVLTPFP